MYNYSKKVIKGGAESYAFSKSADSGCLVG